MVKERGTAFATMFILIIMLLYPALYRTCKAADTGASINRTSVEHISINTGESVVIDTRSPVKWITIGGSDKPDEIIVDAMTVPPNRISKKVYLNGKNAGITDVTLWSDKNEIIIIYRVRVNTAPPDLAELKAKLYEIFPDEKEINVTATHDSITLSGTVSGTAVMSRIMAFAEPYAPSGKDNKRKLINLLEVAGVQQVMLEVRVSEMSRSLSKKLGFNFSEISANGLPLGLSLLDNLVKLPSTGGWPGNPLRVSDNINMIASFLGDNATWTVFIDALKENGLLHILAEPTLITLSGKPASFLAGGEFPIPVPQSGAGATTITIQYKPFGVGLSFTPTVLNSGKINMLVSPEVSELDFSQAVSLQGYIIPSLTTRRASTTVELADGQSFAIAGLLKEEVRESVRKFPVLGDVPVLGALFRSSSFARNETELVIIVTPHLVKPVDLARQSLPTDAHSDPDDFEFYLEGRLEGRGRTPKNSPALPRTMRKGGLEGDFGHILP